MARKHFQDFAYVLCQKFIELPSNKDLVNLVLLGDGTLELDLTARRAMHNRAPVEPLPYADVARAWLDNRLTDLRIPVDELVKSALIINYRVTLSRKPPLHWLSAEFDFSCTGLVEAPDRKYESTLTAKKEWGLAAV